MRFEAAHCASVMNYEEITPLDVELRENHVFFCVFACHTACSASFKSHLVVFFWGLCSQCGCRTLDKGGTPVGKTRTRASECVTEREREREGGRETETVHDHHNPKNQERGERGGEKK